MAETSTFGVAALVAPVDPRQLGLHLEICRMQAELDVVTRRIHALREDRGPAAAGEAPSGPDPVGEVVIDQLVASLLQAGRDELRADEERCRDEVQATLDTARRQADHVMATARAELALALEERTARVDVTPERDLDALYRDAAARTIAPAVAATPTRALAPTTATVTSARPGRVDVTPVAVASASPVEVAPTASIPVPPVPPVVGPLPYPPASAPVAGPSAEESAFATWMAVAGVQGPPPGLDLGGAEEARARGRSGRVRALEVAGVLLAVAILVVLALVVLG